MDDKFLEAKKAKLQQWMEQTSVAKVELHETIDVKQARSLYKKTPVGKYKNIKYNRFSWLSPGSTWVGPDQFEYLPHEAHPLSFVRQDDKGHEIEEITPGHMITDVGSIPRLAGVFRRGLTPWGYAPAYIVHDWQFELHHCEIPPHKSFGEVRDTMMEGVKTMMESGLAPKNEIDWAILRWGINSQFAKDIWNRTPPSCTLPKYSTP